MKRFSTIGIAYFKSRKIRNFLNKEIKLAKHDLVPISIGAMLFLVVFTAYYFINSSKFLDEYPSQKNYRSVTPRVERSITGKISSDFPSSIPLNGKSSIKESFKANYPDSKILQSSVTFSSTHGANENFAYYLTWARDNSWKIEKVSDKPPFMYLKKGNEDINISFDGNNIVISHIRRL